MTARSQALNGRLPVGARWAAYLALSTVGASGLLWSASHDFARSGWMIVERRLLVLHGVSAAVALVVLGALLVLHVGPGWGRQRNRSSGAATVAILTALAVTGLLLYYGSEEWREAIRWTHIGFGIIGTVTLPLHIWLGRRYRSILGSGNAEKATPSN